MVVATSKTLTACLAAAIVFGGSLIISPERCRVCYDMITGGDAGRHMEMRAHCPQAPSAKTNRRNEKAGIIAPAFSNRCQFHEIFL